MKASVLIPDAGTGPANSLVRSLRAGGLDLRLVGYHSDPFTLKKSAADRNYLVPRYDSARFLDTLQHVIDTESVDLVIPNSDDEVEYFSETGRGLAVCGFLPRPETVWLCLDKYRLYELFATNGIAVPATYAVPGRDGLEATWRRFGGVSPVWCRIRKGSASSGATPVKSLEHARGWMRQWEEIRGVAPTLFTLSEYLPGRDFACQCLWKHGRLVLIKTVERLSYFGASDRASGVSGIAALAKTVDDPRIVDVCTRAILAVDPEATGAFSLDLKENARGEPCVAEINPGRFITMMNLFDRSGRHNMASTLVRLALGDDCLDIADPYDAAEGSYFIRHSDTAPVVLHRDALFEGLVDVREARRASSRPRSRPPATPASRSRSPAPSTPICSRRSAWRSTSSRGVTASRSRSSDSSDEVLAAAGGHVPQHVRVGVRAGEPAVLRFRARRRRSQPVAPVDRLDHGRDTRWRDHDRADLGRADGALGPAPLVHDRQRAAGPRVRGRGRRALSRSRSSCRARRLASRDRRTRSRCSSRVAPAATSRGRSR